MNDSGKLRVGMMGVTMVAACFMAGYLLLKPTTPREAAPPPSPETTIGAAAAAPAPAAERKRKYNVTIETNADWSRAILSNATFVTGDPGMGFSSVEMASEAPQQVGRFSYTATEVAVSQKQFATAQIVVKGVVETSETVLQVRLGHGDNGMVTISTPAESFKNDRVTGDGQNFVSGTLRLE
jgi:hypothetical protein